MRIKAIQCEFCKNIVYSRTQEDSRQCDCGGVGAAGGQEYTKFHTAPNIKGKKVNLNIDITFLELYNDWRDMVDSYGIIRINTL